MLDTYALVHIESITVAINELSCLKNVDTQIMDNRQPISIEKNKILEAAFELPAKQQCQSSPFTSKMG